MDNLIPAVIKRWATPAEFDGEGKEIVIDDFQVLTLEEIMQIDGRQPKFPPVDGFVRRLKFSQVDYKGQRQLDMNSGKFQDDLSKFGIKPGDRGILKRSKGTKAHNWSWTKLDDKHTGESK